MLSPNGHKIDNGRSGLVTPVRDRARRDRYLGALTLLEVGLEQLQQYTVDSYSAIPTIGTLFALNFISAALIAAGLVVPVQRPPGPAGRFAVPLLALSGVGVAAGALLGLLVSESSGLFGFMETGCRSAIVVSIAVEVATMALLGAHLVLHRASRPGRRPTGRRGAGAHASPSR